jgi:hypothetical protein
MGNLAKQFAPLIADAASLSKTGALPDLHPRLHLLERQGDAWIG